MTIHHPNCLPKGLTRKNVYSNTYHLYLSSRISPKAHRLIPQRCYAAQPKLAPTKQPEGSPASKLPSPRKSQNTAVTNSPTAQKSLATQNDDPINCPVSTLPAPVNPPTQEPGQSKIRWLLNVGKAYVTFYKTGVKNVWANRKLQKAIDARYQNFTLQHPAFSKDFAERKMTHWDYSREYPLTRAEWRTSQRSKYDWRRVPIFAVILLVFGEWTPLIVAVATPLVPYTCRIPSQIEKTRKKQEERRQRSFRGELEEPITVIGQARDAAKESRGRLQHVCRSLGLYSGIWDNRLTGSFLPPNSWMARMVRDRHDQILLEDGLLLKGAGAKDIRSREEIDRAAGEVVRRLSIEEVKLACEFRGIDILGKPEHILRKMLESWLNLSGKDLEGTSRSLEEYKTYRMFLSRPNTWQ